MTPSSRLVFLERVRKAVAEGNRLGDQALTLPDQEAGRQRTWQDDLVAAYCSALQRAGGRPHVVSTLDEARSLLQDLVRATGKRNLIAGRSGMLDRMQLEHLFPSPHWDLWQPPALPCPESGAEGLAEPDLSAIKHSLFQADIGITGVDWLIAETGSMVLMSRPDQPRSLSLLPPLHIAIAGSRQILPDLFDLFAEGPPEQLPATVTLITGPSKTGDIELKLVTGVHGPEVVHVIIVNETTEHLAREARPSPPVP